MSYWLYLMNYQYPYTGLPRQYYYYIVVYLVVSIHFFMVNGVKVLCEAVERSGILNGKLRPLRIPNKTYLTSLARSLRPV